MRKGDTVVIYMPMVPEAVVAMLACAWLGAVHSVVFGGFAAHELAIRIDDARPKVVVSDPGAFWRVIAEHRVKVLFTQQAARGAGDRPLVADGDRLADRGQLPGAGAPAGQARRPMTQAWRRASGS